MSIVLVGVLLIIVAIFIGTVLYKKDACSKKNGYLYGFPFSCKVKTCVPGFTLDSTGNCVATTCGSGLERKVFERVDG